MKQPKDGATRKTSSGHVQKYNAKLGRWVTQKGPGTLLKSLNLRSRVASEGKEGKELIKKNRQKLGIREEVDVTSPEFKAAVKSGNPDATEGGSRKEIDVTSPEFKKAVTNPKKYLKEAKKNQNKNNNGNTKSESTSNNGSGYTKIEKAGARQSSARNSIARQKYLRKRDKLKAGK